MRTKASPPTGTYTGRPRLQRVHVLLDPADLAFLAAAGARHGRSAASLIREAVANFRRAYETQPPPAA